MKYVDVTADQGGGNNINDEEPTKKLPGRASFFCTFAGTLKPRTRIRVDALQSVDLIRYSNHSDASDTPVDNWRELE